MDVEPRNLGPGHEVKLGLAPGIRVEGSEPEPEKFRSSVVALEDRRATATSEESPHAWAGLPASKEILTTEEDQIGRLDSGGGAKAGAGMLPAPPAMAQGDGTDEIAADLVPDPSACARACKHGGAFVPSSGWPPSCCSG